MDRIGISLLASISGTLLTLGTTEKTVETKGVLKEATTNKPSAVSVMCEQMTVGEAGESSIFKEVTSELENVCYR